MKYKKIHLIYFSPTHTSAEVAHAIAEGTGIKNVEVHDFTCESSGSEVVVQNELTIVAAPVYGGRIAETAIERFRKVKGIDSPVIPISLYGNRDYEDALLELTNWSRQAGFTPVAAGAFIGEHSYSRKDLNMPLAEGRPDQEDCAEAKELGLQVIRKLDAIVSLEELPFLQVKGNYPYKEKGVATPATPVTREEECTQCEHCIDICPTQAVYINNDGEIESDKLLCIKCCDCVKECPQDARVFDTPYTAMLFNNFKVRRTSEIFL